MSRHYQVSYKIEGVQVVNVYLPEGTQMPKNWDAMPLTEQDEWLYEHQESSKIEYQDMHFSKAESVLQVRRLKAVV